MYLYNIFTLFQCKSSPLRDRIRASQALDRSNERREREGKWERKRERLQTLMMSASTGQTYACPTLFAPSLWHCIT